jgi:hypothetical protein
MAEPLNSLSVYCEKVEKESTKTAHVSMLFEEELKQYRHQSSYLASMLYSVKHYFYFETQYIQFGSMRWDKETMAVKNSVALVRKRTIPTEGMPFVGKVSANFCGWRVSRGQRNGSPRPLNSVF